MTFVIEPDAFKGFRDLLSTYSKTTRGKPLVLILLTIVSLLTSPPPGKNAHFGTKITKKLESNNDKPPLRRHF